VDAEGNLNAEEAVTRGELADLIYRLHHPGVYTGQIEYGKATYYGWSWEGVNTASGEIMSQYDYLAAHKTLPFGTYVRVTNLDTNATVTVKIVDRGPYGEGRIIDLTASAFEAIGPLSTGVLNVEIEVVYPTETTSE
jgi:rare lipoprotein A